MPKPIILFLLVFSASLQQLPAQQVAGPQAAVEVIGSRTGGPQADHVQAQRASPDMPASYIRRTGGPQASSILESYIRVGLDSNLALHQRNFDLQRARIDLKRAQSLFYPQAGFSSQYTLADGGRTQ